MNLFVKDTFAAISRLKDSGFTEAQAKGVVDTFRDIDTTVLASKDDVTLIQGYIKDVRIAAKEDFNTLQGEIKALHHDMDGLRKDMEVEFKTVRSEIKETELRTDARFEKLIGEMTLIKWMLGFLIAGVTSIVLKIFLH